MRSKPSISAAAMAALFAIVPVHAAIAGSLQVSPINLILGANNTGILNAINRRQILKNRPIDADSCRIRAASESWKLPCEIKSANFCRLGETVLRLARKKFPLLDQRVMIV